MDIRLRHSLLTLRDRDHGRDGPGERLKFVDELLDDDATVTGREREDNARLRGGPGYDRRVNRM